jgi:hypothetical protein
VGFVLPSEEIKTMDLRTLAEAIAWICTRSLEAVDEIAK